MNISKPVILLLSSALAFVFASAVQADGIYIRNLNERIVVFYEGGLLFCKSQKTGFEFCNGMDRSANNDSKFVGPVAAFPSDPHNRSVGSITFTDTGATFKICTKVFSCQSEIWAKGG